MQLDSTFVAARIIGPVFIAAGVTMITQHDRVVAAVGDFFQNDGLMLSSAFISMLLGLALVTLHRRWRGFTAALISIIGWLAVARGLVSALLPEANREAAIYFVTHPQISPIAGCAIALIGVWLTYAGYISGILRVESPPHEQTRSRRVV